MNKANTELLEESLFTTSKPGEKSHGCVIVVDEKRAISCYHGPHSSLKKADKVTLYNVMDRHINFEVTVSNVSEKHGLVLFKLIHGKFPSYPNGYTYMYPCQDYRQLGVDQKRRPVWKGGIVSRMNPGHFVGTTYDFGDSCSGIFNLKGAFIGISVARKCSGSPEISFTGSNINYKELLWHPETKLISADAAFCVLTDEKDEE
uniref:B30.2/SPRY domain-containing protein n=1 Tax=Panagrellus redivivus TaxID=6233 RepID=A0A7E4W9H6_PANRE